LHGIAQLVVGKVFVAGLIARVTRDAIGGIADVLEEFSRFRPHTS
jgi:hypothetical protein